MKKKLLVIQVAGLSDNIGIEQIRFQQIDSVFPALTCTVQASFRTAEYPEQHGVIANGLMVRPLRKVMFWEQSASLVEGPRIWHKFQENGGRVAMLFWQQSLGESADIILSPAPIHKHHGGMILDCYSQPADLYRRLCRHIGGPFKLSRYWGPFATAKVGRWIAEATRYIISDRDDAPELCLTYLPGLDYNYQRYGHRSAKAEEARSEVKTQLNSLIETGVKHGYEVLIFGDYHIAPVTEAVFPNLILRNHGFLKLRNIKGMLYPDIYGSTAFAMVDHEIAHIYVTDPKKVMEIGNLFEHTAGVAGVLPGVKQAELRVSHRNSGELLLTAAAERWFAYPWWRERREAPEFASHVDIHNKPGFDPGELFCGWPPGSVSLDTSRVSGSHGCIGTGRKVAWGSTFRLEPESEIVDIVSLAEAVRSYLEI